MFTPETRSFKSLQFLPEDRPPPTSMAKVTSKLSHAVEGWGVGVGVVVAEVGWWCMGWWCMCSGGGAGGVFVVVVVVVALIGVVVAVVVGCSWWLWW